MGINLKDFKVGAKGMATVIKENFELLKQYSVNILNLQDKSTEVNLKSGSKIDDNIIWHSGNDGSGSGLDADLLDGKHATDFAQREDYNSDMSKIDNELKNLEDKKLNTAELLTKLKAVDGSGSGLDADLLDGKHATDFAQKKSIATYIDGYNYTRVAKIIGSGLSSYIKMHLRGTSGNVVINVGCEILVNHYGSIVVKSMSGIYTQLRIKIVSNNNESYDILLNKIITSMQEDYTPVYLEVETHNCNVQLYNDKNTTTDYSGITLIHTTKPGSFNISSTGAINPLFINDNIAWHAGNDGSGSGLDADLLDGKHATEIMVPTGTVLWIAGTSIPSGFIKCNGAYLNKTTYSNLYSVIGDTFGSTTSDFRVPDLRGEFIRGWDDGRGVDSGRGFGSWQQDAIRNITGIIGDYGVGITAGINTTGAFAKRITTTNYIGGNGTGNYGVDFDASRVVPTASDNRPRNIALMAIIKY